MSTPTPTRNRALEPLAQDLAVAMLEVLRKYAGDGKLTVDLRRAASTEVAAAGEGAPLPEPQAPLPGHQIGNSRLTDRFQMLGPTGGDAFGESFLGRDTVTGNNVIIRLLHKQLAIDPAFLHSFGTSCDAMIALPRHAHVVETLAHGVHHGQPYVVSESVRGRSLADVISTGDLLPEIDVLRMAEQVAAALQHVKSHTNLHHGDLRPPSVLVAYSGIAGIKAATEVESVRLADFVGPRLPWHDPARLPPLASPFYVAPEQFSPDGVVDARTDMYSLGAIMYHLLTGKPPYPGSPEEVRNGHLGLRIADPGDLVTGLSDCTRQLVTTCLATSRNDRYINLQGFMAACTKSLQTLNGLRSMRFLRKPMRKMPTPRPPDRLTGNEAVAFQAKPEGRPGTARVDKPGTARVDKPATSATGAPPRASFPTPLPTDMTVLDEFEGPDRIQVVSERILRKHRERKGEEVPPAETDTALIRRGAAEPAGASARGTGHQPPATSASGRRPGSTGRPPARRPEVIPAPTGNAFELWAYRIGIALALAAAFAWASGWRPF
jgi:serine/threonine-protein kinase